VIGRDNEAGRNDLPWGNDGTRSHRVSSSDHFRIKTTEMKTAGLQVP
jgi:hypothetical protein